MLQRCAGRITRRSGQRLESAHLEKVDHLVHVFPEGYFCCLASLLNVVFERLSIGWDRALLSAEHGTSVTKSDRKVLKFGWTGYLFDRKMQPTLSCLPARTTSDRCVCPVHAAGCAIG